MRIDEFSALPDGAITTGDRVRFCCFGLDILSVLITPVSGIIKRYIDYTYTMGQHIDYDYKIERTIEL